MDSQILDRIADGAAHLDPLLRQGDVLVTGFPGFVSTHLVRRLVELQPDATFYLLIQARMRPLAEQSLRALAAQVEGLQARCVLIEGDITRPRLGMSSEQYDTLTARVVSVWHLAAIYDLAVPEPIAYQVNVGGTIQVLDFCQGCAHLGRLNYVSTCYVSGQREGVVFEDELDEGQGHRNHYESTKFWAEVEVRRRASEIPTLILRPGIIVGDSRTGETEKYDGPYFFMKLIDKLPDWVPMLNVGKGEALVNLIPIDFAADAMAYLGLKAGLDGKTLHIADPNPMRARDVIALILRAMGRAPAVATLSARLLERAMRRHTVESMLGVPRQTLVYFNHSARYDTRQAQAELRDTHIHCPHLSSYIQKLVDFFREHPESSLAELHRSRQRA